MITLELTDFNNAMFCIFGTKLESAKKDYESLQSSKKQFKEFGQNSEAFYNTEQTQQELAKFRETSFPTRYPMPCEQLMA